MTITDEKYLALTTFRRDGTPKATPIWIVPLADGKAGFTTASSSWKVKRIKNDPRVELRPSDSRGNVRSGSTVVTGRAELSAEDFDQVWGLVLDKYGLAARAILLVGKLAKLVGRGSGTDTAVIITLDEDS